MRASRRARSLRFARRSENEDLGSLRACLRCSSLESPRVDARSAFGLSSCLLAALRASGKRGWSSREVRRNIFSSASQPDGRKAAALAASIMRHAALSLRVRDHRRPSPKLQAAHVLRRMQRRSSPAGRHDRDRNFQRNLPGRIAECALAVRAGGRRVSLARFARVTLRGASKSTSASEFVFGISVRMLYMWSGWLAQMCREGALKLELQQRRRAGFQIFQTCWALSRSRCAMRANEMDSRDAETRARGRSPTQKSPPPPPRPLAAVRTASTKTSR